MAEHTSDEYQNNHYPTKKNICDKFKCNLCKLYFASKQSLQWHISRHTGERPFKCNFCDKSHRRFSELKQHFRTHTGEKPYKCGECGRSYTSSISLNWHQNNQHLARKHISPKFKCNFCERRFSYQQDLRVHIYLHTGERPYKCTTCDKRFTRPDRLRYHFNTRHTEGTLFNCEECSKSYKLLGKLNAHRKTHPGKKPYKCNFCEKSFAERRLLEAHISIHTGEKPYKCCECGRCYRRALSLKNRRCVTKKCRNQQVSNYSSTSQRQLNEENINGPRNNVRTIHQNGSQREEEANSGTNSASCKKCRCVYPSLAELCQHNLLIHNLPVVRVRRLTFRF